jgi:hypothetical protein
MGKHVVSAFCGEGVTINEMSRLLWRGWDNAVGWLGGVRGLRQLPDDDPISLVLTNVA